MDLMFYHFNYMNAPYETLEKIHKTSFFDSWNADTFEALLTTFGTKGIVLYRFEKTAIGFILYRQAFNDSEILTFCVIPEEQNKGYGHKLLSEMIMTIDKPGKCFLEVGEHNKDAIYLYKKNGFKITHIRKNYYGEEKNALMMMLDMHQN